jgi:AbiV family abortive infection protein
VSEPRRICDLAQLDDNDLFAEIATGLDLIHENALRLCVGVDLLAQHEHFRSAEILKGLALEEAAKYLILIDAVRCPRRGDSTLFSDHLWKFSNHLPRCIYAEVCDWRPVDFREVSEGIAREREGHYLDGPSGADWIFRNDIVRSREEALYVDYVADDDGTHRWVSPQTMERLSARMFFYEPVAVRLIRALHEAGFGTAAGLAAIAELWRPWVVSEDTHTSVLEDMIAETIAASQEAGVPPPSNDAAYGTILERWPFPLYAVSMKPVKTSKAELREIQKHSHPEY